MFVYEKKLRCVSYSPTAQLFSLILLPIPFDYAVFIQTHRILCYNSSDKAAVDVLPPRFSGGFVHLRLSSFCAASYCSPVTIAS